MPEESRDTGSVSPAAFAGLRDIALVESPEKSGTLKGVQGSPDHMRAAMLAQRGILLAADATRAARPVTAERDSMKASVLERHFTPVADERVRGRRVTVQERLAPAR